MTKLRLIAIAMIALPLVASRAVAETTAFTADLDGASQAPPTDSKAKGKGEFLYDETSKKLTWTITYWGLSDKAKAAHLHGAASEGANADKMITVSPLQSPIKGAAILTEEQVKALTGGDMYFDVHSAKYPDGEIRGQLKPAS
jgi:CHRD domain